jgi:RNA polymerase sigma-70 factor (ECF subfamily)
MSSPAADDGEWEADFERTVLPEADRLYGLALAIVGDAGEAEDAVQETLISAWRAWRSLRDPGTHDTWLTRICVNHSIRHLRALRRRVLWPHERWEAEERLPSFVEGGLVDVHRAFRSLSAPQRAVLVLHHLDGLTVQECATALGCRPGTARSHLGRAMAKLRRELQDA